MTARPAIRRATLAAAAALPLIAAAAPAAAADDDPVFDVSVEITAATDYMDSGLTNSDHHPTAGITISPSYGIFYATIYGATIDYGADQPWLETKFAIGATPSFGDLSVDVNLARRIKVDDPGSDRWLPYVTGTYSFNERFSASLGAGYYAYDDPASIDFWEFYGAGTVTFDNGASFLAEAYWEPDQDGAGNAYYGLYGTLTVPFLDKFEAVGVLGYEGYEDNVSTPSYLWGELGVTYHVTDHFGVTAGFQANDLSSADCPSQAYTDCKPGFFGRVSYTIALSDLVGDAE